jgi:hypothetical protein
MPKSAREFVAVIGGGSGGIHLGYPGGVEDTLLVALGTVVEVRPTRVYSDSAVGFTLLIE